MATVQPSQSINNSEIISTIIRYGIVFTLLFISFYNIFNSNIQFMMFILLTVTVIFSATFVIRDVMNTPAIFSTKQTIVNIFTTNSAYSKLFLGTFGVGVLFKIISLLLFIVVLNYGRGQLSANNNSLSSGLTSDNAITFNRYIYMFIASSCFMALLVALIFIAYASYPVRVTILNISSIILSLMILGFVSYEMYCTYLFFTIYRHNGIVYQQTTTT